MFHCQFCGNTFTRKYNLLRHQMQYWNESVRNNVAESNTKSDRNARSVRYSDSDRDDVSVGDAESDAEHVRYDDSDRDDEKSNHVGDFTFIDLVRIISDLLKDHRRKWKKDLEKLYQALTATKKTESDESAFD